MNLQYKKCNMFPSHMDNGALNNQYALIMDEKYILLDGFHYTVHGWIKFKRGWHNLSDYTFYREVTKKENEEIYYMPLF